MAPTNAAARLIGGDTAHALCKLPLESSTNSRLRLGPKILYKFQHFWDQTVFAWHDEISMQSSTNFYWIGRRMSQAKAIRKDEQDVECFGGLAMGMAGDFLQIPPVSKSTSRNPSLAVVVDDEGNFETTTDNGERTVHKATRIHRAGFQLWRQF